MKGGRDSIIMLFSQTSSFARFRVTLLHVTILSTLVIFCAGVTAVADNKNNDYDYDYNTCSHDGVVAPQPIGIDLGPDLITAAYAHTAENITALAMLVAGEVHPYQQHVFRLRMEFYQQQNLAKLFGGGGGGGTEVNNIFSRLSDLRKYYLDRLRDDYLAKLASGLVSLVPPKIRDSTTIKWVAENMKILSRVSDAVLAFLRGGGGGSSSADWTEDMTLSDIKHGFIDVLERVKTAALADHDTNITFAIVSVPDFFNKTLCDLVLEACQEVGIETLKKPYARTVMTALGVRGLTDKDTAYFVVDQGRFYADLRTFQNVDDNDDDGAKSKILQMYLPLDPYASAAIDRALEARVIATPGTLQDQINMGADRSDLRLALEKARLLIKDNLDAEIMGKGIDEDHHHEEWPLDLQDWGVAGAPEAVLSWEDVQVVENDYVEHLSNAIYNFLVACRQGRIQSREDPDGSHISSSAPEQIDTAVILTSHHDGALLKRAVRKALGEHIEIVGGSVRDFMLAASGGARSALARKESWERLKKYEKFGKYKRFEEEALGHDEL